MTHTPAPNGRTGGRSSRVLSWVKFSAITALYLLFLFWVESWWGLLVVPFIFDAYITHYIKWGWWREPTVGPKTRFLMSWVDAIVFALTAIYFLNQFFFQNFVIPSSSLEKTLLTGDYLLVSKLSYGPRVPQTPLYMPMTQHTMPLVNCRSYLEWPHWDYRRVKGLGQVQLNDIVVFNYPAGDTVATYRQNEDYYRLCYQLGDEALAGADGIDQAYRVLPSSTITDSLSYAEQQTLYGRIYATGRAIMQANPDLFGSIVSRPTDRRENYVKRCVGLPGQTLEIRHNTIYLDGKPNREPQEVQYAYWVDFKQQIPEEWKRDWGITDEDLYTVTDGSRARMPLTRQVKRELEQHKELVASIQPAEAASDWLYPQNMAKKWTTADYGPVWIPKKGAKLHLTLQNLPIYERPIRVYEGNDLQVRQGKIYINGRETQEYTFKMDYYWMMGDNRDNSADSRFWGFVPEDHVVGKPLFVWISLDPDYGWFSGHVRWNRFFKRVWDIQ